MKYLTVKLIGFYQATLSPDHGFLFRGKYPHGFCRFYPTCSEYAKEAILKKGFLHGSLLGALRILRCNPFSKPRVDSLEISK